MAEELLEEGLVSTEEPAAPPPTTTQEEPAVEEVEEISPDWLDAPVDDRPASQQYNQGYTPEQVAAYQHQMAQMQNRGQYQQPRGAQQRSPDEYLNDFVRDPHGFIDNAASQRAQEIAYNMMQQGVGPLQGQMQQFMHMQVEMQSEGAKRSINDMYKTFSKDETFRGNKQVKEHMDRTLQGLYRDAQYQAQVGNPRALMMFSQPGFAEVALAAVKAQLGVRGGAKGPASVPHVESTSPSASGNTRRVLTPDQEAAAERLGPGGRERLTKAYDDLDKFGDFEG